jgi:hypothetical protein
VRLDRFEGAPAAVAWAHIGHAAVADVQAINDGEAQGA